jgi:hypothetical protein
VKVRFKRGWWRTYGTLTPGNMYRVIATSANQLRLVDDVGEPILFSRLAFDFIDTHTPDDWIGERDSGELHEMPRELATPRDFFERWHDRDPTIRAALAGYLKRACWQDASELDETANAYLRVRWNHSNSSDPVVLYSELDEQRFEVRKVDVFADGRTSWADGRSESDSTRLGIVAVPSIGEIASDSQFEPSVISRAEFEQIWREATPADFDPDAR